MLVEAIAGLIVGVFARWFIPDSQGIGADTLIGVIGALMGGFVYKLFGHKPPFYDWSDWSVVTAVIVALVFIIVLRGAGGRRTIA